MKTAVITGANRGIGLALARGLKRDYRIFGVCRSNATELAEEGAEIIEGVDVTSARGIERLAEQMKGVSIDLLINNAGLLRASTLDGIEDELDDWRAQYEVNALAPLRVTSALSDQLGKGARVVIITSRMGSISDNSSGGAWAYRMSKAAINIAAVSLAHEFRPRGIAVGLFHPGYVRTGMTGGSGLVDPEEAARGLIAGIEALNMDNSGEFRHANGEALPW
jgi:NAD(P)-dependent dehydrogenase (short-subunit alcohol dehydrogenase family)